MRCSECDGTRFRDDGGLRFCEDCGTQMEGYVEEAMDDNAFFASQGYFGQRRAKAKARVAEREPRDDARAPKLDPATVITEIIQAALKAQADVLVEQKRVPECFKDIVREVWLRWLAETGTGSRGVALWHTLALLLVGARLVHSDLMSHELVRGARQGRLPYLAVYATHAQHKELRDGRRGQAYPSVMPSTVRVQSQCEAIAARLGLALPPPNMPAMVTKLVRELALPDCVRDCALRLPPAVWAPAMARARGPSVAAAAAIVVALKLTCGIDDIGTAQNKHFSWRHWAKATMERMAGTLQESVPYTDSEVQGLLAQDRYMQFLDQLFPDGDGADQPESGSLSALFRRVADQYGDPKAPRPPSRAPSPPPTSSPSPVAVVAPVSNAALGGHAGPSVHKPREVAKHWAERPMETLARDQLLPATFASSRGKRGPPDNSLMEHVDRNVQRRLQDLGRQQGLPDFDYREVLAVHRDVEETSAADAACEVLAPWQRYVRYSKRRPIHHAAYSFLVAIVSAHVDVPEYSVATAVRIIENATFGKLYW